MAYDPSARRDSGTTRSRVRGSTAIPEAVCSGKRGGLDMMRGVDEVFLRGDRDESNRLRVSSEIKSNGITAVTAKTAKRILLITTPLAFGLPSSAKNNHALCSPRHRPGRRWQIYILRFNYDTPHRLQAHRPSCKPRSCRGTRQLRVRAVYRHQGPHLSRGCDE